ncbi:MAG: nitroreductase [Phenylobacterium sp.]|uniref:nitroreductase family protein n=1 Tax=Phenylobacterium sp. TaxID=1871053 RepID=UPI0025D249F4|nr:nitroreductase [Phenylobacterium sp.]MCA6245173.1 nitroreductase [Phenylobacterium sp.]MCA6329664.1 nitroreductase [Phenylobacterium sp.]
MTRRSRTALPPAPSFGEPVAQAAAPEVLDFLSRRRSASALTLGGPGPSPAEIETLIRLASRVPDHGKLAPWRFVVLAGNGKAAFADRLEAVARSRGDDRAVAKLGKLRTPPACIAVISRPREAEIREWEQILSAGAVCTTLLYAATAMGYGANWITDWYAYDAEACAILGLSGAEKVAGFILIGEPGEPPRERERPSPESLTIIWRG